MEAEHSPDGADERAVTGAPPGERWPRHTEALCLGLVSLVALGLRALVAARTRVIFDDGPGFIAIARAMARGDFGSALAHPYHPLYSLLVWLTPGSSGHEELVGVAWSVAAGTACVLLLWWLMRPLFGARLAVVAAALLAAHPYAVRMSADVQSDTVHLAFFLLGLGLVQRAVARADAGLAFAAGVASALAYLTRPEGIGVLVVGLVLFAAEWARGRVSTARGLAFVAALGGGFALLALPYMRIIQLLSGEWQLTQKKSLPTLLGVGHLAGNAWAIGAGVGVVVVALAAGVWVRRRGGLAWPGSKSSPSAALAWGGVVAGVVILGAVLVSPSAALRWAALFASTLRPELVILLVAGIVASVRSGEAPSSRSFFIGVVALVHGAATFALLVTAGYLSRRHLLPLAVVLLGHAALGLAACAAWIAARWPAAARTQGRVVIALVLVVVAIALPKALRVHREEGVAARLAAEWVRERSAPGDRVASERSRTAYYAALVWVPMYDAAGLRDGADLRRRGVRWVIAGKRELASPAGAALAVAPAPGQRFELAHEVEAHGYRALVFEVIEPGG